MNILWRVAIFDEAHRLKNKNCKMLEGLKEMRMVRKCIYDECINYWTSCMYSGA